MPKNKKSVASEETCSTESLILSDNDIQLDLGNHGAACETFSFGCDTITLDSSTIATITLPSVGLGNSGSYVISTGGGGSGGTFTTGSPYSWNTIGTSSSPTVNIDADGVNIKEGGDLKIDGKSLKNFMEKMEERLAILVPDPKKLEKFEALKKAYDHYKIMEKLCQEEKEENSK